MVYKGTNNYRFLIRTYTPKDRTELRYKNGKKLNVKFNINNAERTLSYTRES
jgi:hypothetical protein